MRLLKEKILEKTQEDPLTQCLEYQGSRDMEGYGRITYNKVAYKTHRVMSDAIGTSLLALHRCDNPCCCNPSHLFLGTHKDNAVDRNQKGRAADVRGDKNGAAKLTEEQVEDIRILLATKMFQKDIANQFNIAQTTVSAIKRNVIRKPNEDSEEHLGELPASETVEW